MRNQKWRIVVCALAVVGLGYATNTSALADPGGGTIVTTAPTEKIVSPPVNVALANAPDSQLAVPIPIVIVNDTESVIALTLSKNSDGNLVLRFENASPAPAINASPQTHLAKSENAPPNGTANANSPNRNVANTITASTATNDAMVKANVGNNLFEGANAVSKLGIANTAVDSDANVIQALTYEGVDDVVFPNGNMTVSSA